MSDVKRDGNAIQIAISAYEAGAGMREIAEGQGASLRTVRGLLVAAGVEIRRRGRKADKVTVEQVRALVEEGLTQEGMGVRLGVGRGVVRGRLGVLGGGSGDG